MADNLRNNLGHCALLFPFGLLVMALLMHLCLWWSLGPYLVDNFNASLAHPCVSIISPQHNWFYQSPKRAKHELCLKAFCEKDLGNFQCIEIEVHVVILEARFE